MENISGSKRFRKEKNAAGCDFAGEHVWKAVQ
jgi:hypothetical protein